MKRRLLTKHQTDLIQSIKAEIEKRCSATVTITDILSACFYEFTLSSITSQVKSAIRNRELKQQLRYNQQNFKTFCGHIQSNGLLYRAVVAVRDKTELKRLIQCNTLQLKYWKLTDNTIHVEIATASPRTFFGYRTDKVGRPSKDNFFAVPNPAPVTVGKD